MSAELRLDAELETQSPGALFYRADLHIHSFGGSHDVADVAATPEAIVSAADAEGLRLIAITDHNRVSSVAAAISAAKRAKVIVIPGVELTTPEGHLLCYFPDLTSLTAFFSRLQLADDGTKNSRCQDSMLACLDFAQSFGGLGILAHVDGDGGLEAKLPGFPPHKSDILCHAALFGIELKDPNSGISYSSVDSTPERALISATRRSTLNLGPSQELARVLFSDAHRLAAVGRNSRDAKHVTRLKMNTPCFEGLRLALSEGDARIRLEDDVPIQVPYVSGLRIDGGFLDGQVFRFSRNLNCIIGGRGTGKSTSLEVVRSLSLQNSDSRLVDCEVWPDVAELLWLDAAGVPHSLIRRKGLQPEDAEPLAGIAAARFPIESYGQGETAQTSAKAQDDPEALLEYLDQFVGVESEREQEELIRQQLLENQSAIEDASVKISEIPQIESILKMTQGQLAAFQRAKATEVVALERQLAGERALQEEIRETVADLPSGLTGAPGLARMKEIRERDISTVRIGTAQFKKFMDLSTAFEAETVAMDTSVSKRVSEFAKAVSAQLDEWKLRERESTAVIESKRKELAAQGLKLDLALVKKLSTDEARFSKNLATLRSWVPYRAGLEKTRRDLLEKYRKVRQQIALKRQSWASKASAALESSLKDLTVSVKFQSDSLSPEAENLIREVMGWKTNQVPRAGLLVAGLTVPKLLDAVRKRDVTALTSLKTVDGAQVFAAADAREIFERLSQPRIKFNLERCLLHERPRITVTKFVKGAGGKEIPASKDFRKLSLGQQQSVLLALMLSSESNDPLIIDQPEDNLDGEFIYHSLIPVLRRAKERRQVIVVTHNANIAVLADAEMIFCLKSLRDRARIVCRGSIDDAVTCKQACEILEGSEDAFVRRSRIYGLPGPK